MILLLVHVPHQALVLSFVSYDQTSEVFCSPSRSWMELGYAQLHCVGSYEDILKRLGIYPYPLGFRSKHSAEVAQRSETQQTVQP